MRINSIQASKISKYTYGRLLDGKGKNKPKLFTAEEEKLAFSDFYNADVQFLKLLFNRFKSNKNKLLQKLESYNDSAIHCNFTKDIKDFRKNKDIFAFCKAVRNPDSGRDWMAWAASYAEERGFTDVVEVYNHSIKLRNKIANSNLFFVVSIAHNMSRTKPWLFDDFVQEGNVGLMKAVNKFDINRGFRFSTFAMNWIKGQIIKSINYKETAIALPSHIIYNIRKILKVKNENFKRQLTNQEIADLVGLTLHEVEYSLSYQSLYFADRAYLSTSQPLGDEDSATVGDMIPDMNVVDNDEVISKAENMKTILDALKILTPKELEVIQIRFNLQGKGEDFTLREIGDKKNLSRERIRQIERRGLDKLRYYFQKENSSA
jgi:RNA polymerase sigma factor (sigma-70 family)